MAGRFMDKETLEQKAQELGVDLTGLTWPQKQGAVMNAMKQENQPIVENSDGLSMEEIKIRLSDPIDDIFSPVELNVAPVEKLSDEVKVHVEDDSIKDPMASMRGKKVMIAPEMAPTSRQLFGYDEVLDEEVTVEEVVHDVDAAYTAGKDLVTGTYNVTGSTGKRVVARTALPKEGCGITFRPDVDLVPVAKFRGREGYLWTHHRLPNVKQLLKESGYYEEYKSRFVDEPAIWHSGGKLLACDISLVHSIMSEIEHKEAEKRARQKQAMISMGA